MKLNNFHKLFNYHRTTYVITKIVYKSVKNCSKSKINHVRKSSLTDFKKYVTYLICFRILKKKNKGSRRKKTRKQNFCL